MINKYAGIEYEDVVRQYADDITRLCVVWTQNEEAAKDCFQNTFLKLYQTEQTFREEEHIKAWLYTVARNECRDYHRQFWNRKVDIGYVPQQKAGRNAGQDCCPHGRQAPRGAVRTADPSRLGRVGQRGGADSGPLVTVARR